MPLRGQVVLNFRHDDPPNRVVLPSVALSAERVELASSAPYEFSKTGQSHYLALHDIVIADGEMRVGGSDAIRDRDLRRTLTFLPNGVSAVGWSHPLNRKNAFTAIHFEGWAIPDELRSSTNFQEPAVYFQDKRLQATLMRLDTALRRSEPFLDLLGETICDLAIVEFGLRQSKTDGESPRSRALDPRQVARVRDFIRAHLADSISLSDLSQAAGLSKFHFTRAFKAATGLSPYREVLTTRTKLARQLVGEGRNLSEVASLTGFANVTQLSRALRQYFDS